MEEGTEVRMQYIYLLAGGYYMVCHTFLNRSAWMLLFTSGLHELYLTSSVAGNIGARCNEGFVAVGLKLKGLYWFFGVGLVPS